MLVKIEGDLLKEIEMEGWVEIDLPNPVERIQLAAKASLDGTELASALKQAESLASYAYDRIKGLDLKFEGHHFKSMAELENFSICNKVLYFVGSVIVNGVPLGKS